MDSAMDALEDSYQWAIDQAANTGSLGDREDDLEVFVDGSGRPYVIPYNHPIYLEGKALERWKAGKYGERLRGPASRAQRRMIFKLTGQHVGRIPLSEAQASAAIGRIVRGKEVVLQHAFANGTHLEKRLKRVDRD